MFKRMLSAFGADIDFAPGIATLRPDRSICRDDIDVKPTGTEPLERGFDEGDDGANRIEQVGCDNEPRLHRHAYHAILSLEITARRPTAL